MADQTIPPEPTGYARLAADLRSIADLFDKASDVPMSSHPYIRLNIQPGGDDEQVIDRTDRLGEALFGKTGTAREMSNGNWHYDVEGQVGTVGVHVYDRIAETTVREREQATVLAEKEAELARLRAEVEQLRAQVDPHVSAVAEAGLVDEPESKPLPGCLPGCRHTDEKYGKGTSSHAEGCPEWAAANAHEDRGEPVSEPR